MVTDPPASPPEFRRYRRFVSWFVLTFVSLGSGYLLVSVGVTIYRRRNAVPAGARVGALASPAELESCTEELADVEQALERHLENFHHLLAHYDTGEAQRWAEDQSFWLGQWKAAGERCGYSDPRRGPFAKQWEELGVIHADLRETEATYTKELLRFVKAQAPRLDLIRERLESVARRIRNATSSSAASGDTHP